MRKAIHLAWFTTMQDRTGVLDDGEMDALDDAFRLYQVSSLARTLCSSPFLRVAHLAYCRIEIGLGSGIPGAPAGKRIVSNP
jgi:hypothetical protein